MPSDAKYLGLARAQAAFSKCERAVGGIAVGPAGNVRSTGYNGLPRGLDDDVPARKARPAKYLYEEHAERNVIYQAARDGISLEGCTLYVWVGGSDGLSVCADCARAVIQAGLARVVLRKARGRATPLAPMWRDSAAAANEMLAEAGIAVSYA